MGSHIQRVMVLSTQFVALLGCLSLAVDAIPAPVPQPAPEPFFGLGLLGRLLAAYSRGEKEEDFGNCKCNRRTFHTKEKDKDKVRVKDCDCSGYPTYEYGAPSVSYNAPTYSAPSYEAPAPSYNAPSYNPPCAFRRTFGNHGNKDKDKDKNPCTAYYR